MQLRPTRLPPPLQPGDTVCALAPSGAVREFEAVQRGFAIWRDRGFQVEFSDSWDAIEGYLAGSDLQRRLDLSRAWRNPKYKALLCVRGGYGCTRLLEDWSWELAEGEGESQFDLERTFASAPDYQIARPKWLIGFSDITALLWSLAGAGVAGLHAPLLGTLAGEPEWSRDRLFAILTGSTPAALQGKGWGNGRGQGLLLPANLSVATHLLGTSSELPLQDTILALEDVSEAPYRLDRYLTQWRASGALRGVRGIALGRFSRCEAAGTASSWTVAEVLRDRLQDLGIPIVADLPFGHDGPNAALLVGRPASLDGDGGSLTFTDP